MKKKILLIYDKMMVGGTTTSLLSLLDKLDANKYEVDLLLLYGNGPMQEYIPYYINVYTVADNDPAHSKLFLGLKFLFSKYVFLFFKAWIEESHGKNKRLFLWQFTNMAKAYLTKPLTKEYDVAIGFMEGWSDCFVTRKKIIAKKKLTWIHLDYMNSYLSKYAYRDVYERADRIILVSDKCKDSFDSIYPQYRYKSIKIENILTKNIIMRKAGNVETQLKKEDKIKLITVCRIDFSHKGIDRVINAFIEMQKRNINNPFIWEIIGDGPDLSKLNQMIADSHLEEFIHCHGELNNPLPYVLSADAFILTSRYEGKPMAVTEALLLGKPCIVTEYASAREQIENMKTGIIIDNNDNSVVDTMIWLASNTHLIGEFSKNVQMNDYSNSLEFRKIEQLL